MADPVTTIFIDGTEVDLSPDTAWPSLLQLNLGGYSTLTLAKKGGPLLFGDDPWLHKPIQLKIDDEAVFSGRICDSSYDFTVSGWSTSFMARDLRAEADKAPITDDFSLTDSAAYNFRSDNPSYLPTRAGKNVGEILTDLLTMQDNAEFLDGKGIGGYTSLDPPTLPPATLSDFASLTLEPVQEIRISGGKFLSCVSTWVESVLPNHKIHVQGDGVIRVINLRDVVEQTLTLEVDLVNPPSLRKSTADTFQRVVIRGRPLDEAKYYTLRTGTLVEDFGDGVISSEAVKAAWVPEDYEEDKEARAEGTCECTDTLTVVLTPAPAAEWGADEWDQTHRMGWLHLFSETVGATQVVSRMVTSNTATSGGTSTFSLDQPLPDLSYTSFLLYGISSTLSLCWRKYRVADSSVWPSLTREFSVPVINRGANGDAASMTTFPIGEVCFSATGDPPYGSFPLYIQSINNEDGTVIFASPSYNIAGRPPDDVRALLGAYTSTLTAVAPASGYEGTSHDDYGADDTWVVTLPEWRDPGQQANMEAYAEELLKSVKDTIIEGSVVINDLWKPALTFGKGISIDADGYETGLEEANLLITSCSVQWNSQSASHWTTSVTFGNRLAPLSSSQFLKPERRLTEIPSGNIITPFEKKEQGNASDAKS